MTKQALPKIFLMVLIASVLILCFFIFKPFLIEIIAAVILVSIFYRPFQWLTVKLKGRRSIASLIMCLLVVGIVIVPTVNLLIYGVQKSVEAYGETIKYLNDKDITGIIETSPIKQSIIDTLAVAGIDTESFKSFIINAAKNTTDIIIEGGSKVATGTFNFILSLVIIVFTMYFFFIDGEHMIEKLMKWTPLPNKYDREIFKRFRDVSYSVMISTFVTAIIQGLIGAIAFMIVGLPAFFAGIFMAIFSLLPYFGAALIWLPAAIYLLIIGKIGYGIFMLLWGVLVVSTADNLIRAYLIKGKAQVHPIFIIFAILGGISLFGFWGIVFGPLIISLAVTLLHIYELEYKEILEK